MFSSLGAHSPHTAPLRVSQESMRRFHLIASSHLYRKSILGSSSRPPNRLFTYSATARSLHAARAFGNSLTSPKIPKSNFIAKRTFFFSAGRSLSHLYDEADQNPDDLKRQNALYRELVEEDPAALIERFESKKYARDKQSTLYYLCALYETRRLERVVPSVLNGAKKDSAAIEGLASGKLGTKDYPIHVTSNPGSGSVWKNFMTFLNILAVGGVLYSIFMFNEQKLGGISLRVHKLFNKSTQESVKTFDDVQGCDEAKEELFEVVEFLKNPEKFNKLGARLPKGVLLVGPPGTGKTLLAKAVAGEAGVPFIYASGSEFDELFVGIGSLRIRQMFEAAKQQSPSIIFIDEIDAIGSKRNPRDPQHSRMSLNQLLVELDGFLESSGVIVIAATNFPETLDKALLRPGRFDRHIHVPLPDVRGRKQILSHYLKTVPQDSSVSIDTMARATPGFSGADLAKLVNQAKIMASVQNKGKVEMRHLESSRDEMILGIERKSAIIADEDRKLTAYHESGHAIVALYTPFAAPIHKATIIPRGQALGMVAQLPEKDEISLTKLQLLSKMDVAMGGRVAEEFIFGSEHVTTGASSDFQQATNIARAMVTKFGMSEKIGQAVVKDEELEFLSSETRNLIEQEMKELMQASYERAKNIIISHKMDLHQLASALLEYETLSKQEIDLVLSGGVLQNKN